MKCRSPLEELGRDDAVDVRVKSVSEQVVDSGEQGRRQVGVFKSESVDPVLMQCQEVIQSNPKNWEAHFTLAKLFLSRGDRKQSRFHAQHAIKYNPSDVEVRAFISEHFQGLSDMYEVDEASADTVADLEKLSQLYLAKGHYDKATLTMQSLLKKDVNHVGALQFLAQNAMEAEDFTAAISFLKRLKHIKPNDYYLDYNLAVGFRELGQEEESKAWFRRVYEHTTDEELRREVKAYL